MLITVRPPSDRLYSDYSEKRITNRAAGFGPDVIDNVFASNRNRELATTKQLITRPLIGPRAKKATNEFFSTPPPPLIR